MVDATSDVQVDEQAADPARLGGSVMGKRYTDPESGIQVLCVAAGKGTLTIGDAKLDVLVAKQLPSSD